MGFIKTTAIAFFFFSALCFSATPANPPAPSVAPSGTAATPAVSQNDQDLLKSKFEKMQKVLQQEETPAAVQEKERAYKPTNSKDVMVLSFKIMLYIAILSMLLYFGIKAFKKGSMGRNMSSFHKSLEVMESVHLGPHKTVSLVKVLNRVLVVGVTEKAINLLTVIEDEAALKQIKTNNQETASGVAGSFSNSVNGFLAKFKKDDNGKPFRGYSQEGGEEE